MGLTNTEHIILIILSLFLAIFLALGIISLIYIIRIQNSIKNFFKKIGDGVEKVSGFGDQFKTATSSRFANKILDIISGQINKKRN
jgi:hypothetical protein